ncbi:MAG: GNAT family N-acetyltransferase [Dehalococcoidales bacterium]|nr:GNAT family N-acetyltransferase [Dehalococcoidales bacterium]
MSSDLNNLIRLKKEDIKPAVEVIARAFQDYPLSVYFIPDDSKRRKRQPAIFRPMIVRGLKYGEVYATSVKFEAVAVWFKSVTSRDSTWSMVTSGFLVMPFIAGISSFRRQMAFGKYAMAVRKRVAPFPHWYLQVLAVDPQFQGQGIASRLLKPMLERIEKDGLPCYLETQAEQNVALYEHLGFRVVEEGTIPGSDIKSWAMLRGKGNR